MSKNDNDDDPNKNYDDDDDYDDPKTKKSKSNLAILSFQIDLLNQAPVNYKFLMKVDVGSKHIILFAVDKPEKRESKNKCFAVKINRYQTEQEKQRIDKEIRIVYIFSQFSSIITYQECFEYFWLDSLHKFVVMNYFAKLDLMEASHIFINNKLEFVGFQDEDFFKIAFQALNILKILKDNKVVHNNICLDNFLVHSLNPIYIVLTDFEDAEIMEDTFLQNEVKFCYTNAPEILENKRYDYSADMWSLGFLLYQLAAKENPFYIQREMTKDQVLDNISEEKLEKKEIDDPIFGLISQMLVKDPKNRITVENALASNLFDGMTIKEPENLPNLVVDTKEKTSIYARAIINTSEMANKSEYNDA